MSWVWYSSGALFAALSLVLLAWALLFDRARGRVRCPKCWYAADGLAPGSPCPECGKTPKSPRALRRTRRKWRCAFVSLFLFVVSGVLAAWPSFVDGSWIKHAPTSVLVISAWRIENPADPLAVELERRVRDDHMLRLWDGVPSEPTSDAERLEPMWSWQRRILASNLAVLFGTRNGTVVSPENVRFARTMLWRLGPDAAPASPRIAEYIGCNPDSVPMFLELIESIGPAAAPTVPTLVDFIKIGPGHPEFDKYGREYAVEVLALFGPASRDATPTLIELLDEEPRRRPGSYDIVGNAVVALGAIGPDAVDAVAPLLEIAHDDFGHWKYDAVHALARIAPLDNRVRPVLIDAIMSDDADTRRVVADAIRSHAGILADTEVTLATLYESDLVHDRVAAIRGLNSLGSSSETTASLVEDALSDPHATVRMFAVESTYRCGLMEHLREKLVSLQDNDEDLFVRTTAARVLSGDDAPDRRRSDDR